MSPVLGPATAFHAQLLPVGTGCCSEATRGVLCIRSALLKLKHSLKPTCILSTNVETRSKLAQCVLQALWETSSWRRGSSVGGQLNRIFFGFYMPDLHQFSLSPLCCSLCKYVRKSVACCKQTGISHSVNYGWVQLALSSPQVWA